MSLLIEYLLPQSLMTVQLLARRKLGGALTLMKTCQGSERGRFASVQLVTRVCGRRGRNRVAVHYIVHSIEIMQIDFLLLRLKLKVSRSLEPVI